jgi:thiopurine S-methyltransferase
LKNAKDKDDSILISQYAVITTLSISSGVSFFMEKDFWLKRWKNGEIGFHLDSPHPLMEQCVSGLSSGQTVLLPLCGKSLDMLAMLEQGLSVVGVEIAEQAVEEFFLESQIKYSRRTLAPFDLYQGSRDRVKLYLGDFFKFGPEIHAGGIELIYDRAGLVALPKNMRSRYMSKIGELLDSYPDAIYMLICLEIDQRGEAGPPFSISHQEICEGFSGRSIEVLSELRVPLRKGTEINTTQRFYRITG